jgi:HSP20 family protein
MAMIRFDPVRELLTLQDRMNRLFDGNTTEDTLSMRGSWVPPVDIYETDGHDLVISAELPDMRREDITVTVEQHTLTIKGEKKISTDVKEDRYRRIERGYGHFSRSFSLPTTVDATRISAEYRNGVLTITLPYREESRPRTVTVEVAA